MNLSLDIIPKLCCAPHHPTRSDGLAGQWWRGCVLNPPAALDVLGLREVSNELGSKTVKQSYSPMVVGVVAVVLGWVLNTDPTPPSKLTPTSHGAHPGWASKNGGYFQWLAKGGRGGEWLPC